MKKFLVVMFSLVSVLFLCSCTNNVLADNKTNYTYTYSIDGEVSYKVLRDGSNYGVVKNNSLTYYASYESGTFEYSKEDDVYSTEEVESDLYEINHAISTLSYDDLEKEGEVYNIKKLSDNEFISLLIEDDIEFDTVTVLKDAYEANLIEPYKATVEISNGQIDNITIIFDYNKVVKTIVLEFDDYSKTDLEMPSEGYEDKAYSLLVNDDNAVVTIKFGDYGSIEVSLFDDEYVDYFIYLIKNNKYRNVYVEEISDVEETSSVEGEHAIFVGDNELSENYLKSPESTNVNNDRGVVSLVFKNDDSNFTSEFVINYGDSCEYNDNYYSVGGIISGFDVLDLISSLPSSSYTDLQVKVSVKLNDYDYSKPSFDDAD